MVLFTENLQVFTFQQEYSVAQNPAYRFYQYVYINFLQNKNSPVCVRFHKQRY